jgi:hypothetical protein
VKGRRRLHQKVCEYTLEEALVEEALAKPDLHYPFKSRKASSISRRASSETGTKGSRGGPP